MNWYDNIKVYYGLKIYNKVDVKIFVVAGWITKEQYEEITGEAYLS